MIRRITIFYIAPCKDGQPIKSIDQLHQKINEDKPVVLGLSLSDNFFVNKGFVLNKDATSHDSKSEHAKGHAVLVVGYIGLPEELHRTEGKLCFVVANSWGRGWGKGGYSCLSEKWLSRHRNENPFVALESIKI